MVKPIDYASLTERRCSRCALTKPVAEFNRYADTSAPLTGWRCGQCNTLIGWLERSGVRARVDAYLD